MHITRRHLLQSTLFALTAASVPRITFAEDPAVKSPFAGKLETVRIADDVRVLTNAGGNVTVYFDADRLLVIDSGVPERGAELLKTIGDLGPFGIRQTLFNTHWHYDHTGGNEVFAKAGFTVVGTGACRERLGKKISMIDLPVTTEPIPEPARPSITFDTTLGLFEASPVRLTKVAPAHTDTDAFAFLEKHNLLVTGDLHFSGVFPVIDRATGGSLDGMIAATTQLLAVGDDKTRVVPGHGPVGDKTALRAQLALLSLAHEKLEPFVAKKATMDEVVAAAPFADLDDKWGRGFVRSPLFTRMTYGQWLTR